MENPKPVASYSVTPEERAHLNRLRDAAIFAKASLYDLNEAVEAASKEHALANQRYVSAVHALAASRGEEHPEVFAPSPDNQNIIRRS